MKTIDGYLNDPRITNDPDMQDVPFCIKKIHAARLKIQDETKDMTPLERTRFYNNDGIPPKYAYL
jgi:hypothetical protein